MSAPAVHLGIEVLAADPPKWLQGRRLGLLCNQASCDRAFRHSREILAGAFPGGLISLFTPQHGFFADKQDNMIETAHGRDPFSGLPVWSLYGETRTPTPAMLADIDVLVIDIQDVGTRVYTFFSTVAYCLKACAAAGRQVLVLDRPNPLGGLAVEGNLLAGDCRSFVGLYPLPMRHGLTVAEFARLANDGFGIGADLSVIPMAGWQRGMLFPDTGLPWVFPSPNMPTFAAALVYPGQVLWEGTNVSEGRGTTMPFELCGAPYWQPAAIRERLSAPDLAGAILRPVAFEPTANKWQGSFCCGFQIHVTDPVTFQPYRLSLALLRACLALYPEALAYKPPPYEYEFERLPLDLILGSRALRLALEAGADLADLVAGWQEDLASYRERVASHLLYPAAPEVPGDVQEGSG
ncbi:MAG: DUF1343 domain-containing protein [Thermodesulfobacteriota bacterium]